MRSKEDTSRWRAARATNPQRRPVLPFPAGRRVPPKGNADGSGAAFPGTLVFQQPASGISGNRSRYWSLYSSLHRESDGLCVRSRERNSVCGLRARRHADLVRGS